MMILIAALVTFLFTTVLTIAGLGAAFILIPVLNALGLPLREAMSIALLLNAVAMVFASWRYGKQKLIEFRAAIPILIVAALLSPLGAWSAHKIPEVPLRWFFIAFLLFAAFMMLLFRQKTRTETDKPSTNRFLVVGGGVGAFAGYLGGLLGVGGGNIILPMLVWQGFDSKKASATTSFIVIFSSFTGFLGHASLGAIHYPLLAATVAASIAGAVLGSYLMTDRLNRRQVKQLIGAILIVIAGKMIFKLLS